MQDVFKRYKKFTVSLMGRLVDIQIQESSLLSITLV